MPRRNNRDHRSTKMTRQGKADFEARREQIAREGGWFQHLKIERQRREAQKGKHNGEF